MATRNYLEFSGNGYVKLTNFTKIWTNYDIKATFKVSNSTQTNILFYAQNMSVEGYPEKVTLKTTNNTVNLGLDSVNYTFSGATIGANKTYTIENDHERYSGYMYSPYIVLNGFQYYGNRNYQISSRGYQVDGYIGGKPNFYTSGTLRIYSMQLSYNLFLTPATQNGQAGFNIYDSDYQTTTFYPATGNVTFGAEQIEYINFDNGKFKQFLIDKGIGTSSGITVQDAIDVTEIPMGYNYPDCGNLTDLRHFTSVSALTDDLFYGDTNESLENLYQVTFPPNLKVIGRRNFMHRFRLSSVYLPDGLTTIGSSAFQHCIKSDCTTGLSSVRFPDSLTTFLGNETYEIGTTIGANFEECKLSDIVLPDNITMIPCRCFSSQGGYLIPVVPDLEQPTPTLTHLKLPRNLTTIGEEAFYGNDRLPWIVIPSKVTKINHGAFTSGEYLRHPYRSVLMMGKTPPTGNYVSDAHMATVYVRGEQALNAYKSAKWDSKFQLENIKPVINPESTVYSGPTRVNVSIAPNLPQEMYTDPDHNFSYSSIQYKYSDYSTTSGYTTYNSAFNVDLTYCNTPITIQSKWTFEGDVYTDTAVYSIKLPTPVISPYTGTFYDEVTISITDTEPDVDIYYTTDGSEPTTSSTLYTGPFKLETIGSTTIKAKAIKCNAYSDVAIASYKILLSPPTITPSGGTYMDEVDVSITCPNSGATIYYTTDGSTPTTNSIRYTGPFKINKIDWNIVRAIAYKYNGYSEVVSERYIIHLSSPVISPSGGTYMDEVTGITITCPNSLATIYYTTDGTTPTSGSTQYTSSFDIDTTGTTTVKAVSFKDNQYSNAVSETYEIILSRWKPVMTPESGVYYGPITMTITSEEPEATLSYTTSNQPGVSIPYSQPVQLDDTNGAITVTPYSEYSGITLSGVTRTYDVYVCRPLIETPEGTYTDEVEISIKQYYNDSITYTINNGSPQSYSEPFKIEVGGTYTITASSVHDGTTYSSSKTYTVVNKTPDTPVITPASGNYGDDLTVQIGGNGNYPIYYTTDGSTPTSASTLYTEPFVIEGEGTYTVKAVALNKTAYSTVATNNYTIAYRGPLPPVLSPSAATFTIADEPIVEMFAEDENSEIYYTIDGSAPTKESARYTNPIYLSSSCTVKAIAYNEYLRGKYSTVTTGTYTVQQTQKSAKARRMSNDENGIYIKNITYSGLPAESRAITLPTVKVTDNEADVTWGYHADNVDEDYGEYGTRCKVSDTSILIHLEFTHEGKKYVLEKEIPCTAIEQDAIDKPFDLDIVKGEGTVTLENHLEAHICARVKQATDETITVLTDITDYTLKGESTMGTFTCVRDGGYFVYDGTLSLNYSGATNPAREIILTLSDSNGNELDTYNVPVTFAPGSIFEVRDDAIRMAVQGSKTYTDGQISGVTNQISQLEVNISGITGTVSAVTNTVSGISADVSQLQQTASSLTSTVTELDGEAMKWSQIDQVSSAITLDVFNEFNENTGIRIEDGKITMNADNTEILGNLNLMDGENGLTVFDQAGNPRINLRNTPVPAYGPDMFITEGSFASSSPKTTGTAGNSITCMGELDPIGTVGNGDIISLTGMWITADTFSGNTLTHPKLSVSYTIYAGDSDLIYLTPIIRGTGTTAYQSWRTGNFFTIDNFSFISNMSGTMHIWFEATFTLPAGTDGGIATLNGYATSKPVALTMIGNNGFYSFSDDNNHFYTSSGGTYLHTEYDYNKSYKRVGAIALKDGYLLRYGPSDGITAGNSQGYVPFDGMYSYTSLYHMHIITGQSSYTMTRYPSGIAHTTDPVPVYYAKDTDSVIEVDYLDVESDIVYVDVKNLTKFNGRKIRVLKSIDVTVWLIDSETTSASGSVKAKSAIVGLNDAPPTSSQILNGVEFPGNGDQINWDGAEIIRYHLNNAWKVIS